MTWRTWAALALLFGAGFDVGLIVGRNIPVKGLLGAAQVRPETQYQIRLEREESPLL